MPKLAIEQADNHIDLVPMIDCIMLLLIFFVMTTNFMPEEGAIGNLLPTDSGQPEITTREMPKQVNITIYPADTAMVSGHQPSDYALALERMTQRGAVTVLPAAMIRVGAREPIRVDHAALTAAKDSPALVVALTALHTHIAAELAAYEVAGLARNQQPNVVIHGFSGLPWAFALSVLDSVRAYEQQVGHLTYSGDPRQLDLTRAITMAPPRLRNFDRQELGQELYELVRVQ